MSPITSAYVDCNANLLTDGFVTSAPITSAYVDCNQKVMYILSDRQLPLQVPMWIATPLPYTFFCNGRLPLQVPMWIATSGGI